MRICGIERDLTACNNYRVLQPLAKLKQHGMADVVTIPDWELRTNYAVDKVMEADIVVFQRPADNNWFKFIDLCQKHGKFIVTDYDDDPFRTSPLNPYYKFVGTKNWQYRWPSGEVDMLWQDGVEGFSIERSIERQDMFRASFRKADMVTTTTDILANEFKELNTNTLVLPNLIDFYYYRKYPMIKKEVRIGYQGGASHYEDIYMIRDAVKEVLARNDNAKFVYFGDLRFKRLFQEIPSGRIEFHDWVKHIAYPYKLSLMNFDIGICPLIDNTFNRNKSCLKFLDYSATGTATVAQDIPPYNNVIKQGETGLLANTHEEWIEAIDGLVKDETKRKTLATNAYDFIYEEYNADKKAYLWRDAYESILKRRISDDVSTTTELVESSAGR